MKQVMQIANLLDFEFRKVATSPLAIVFCEDDFAVKDTFDWLEKLGFSDAISIGQTNHSYTTENISITSVSQAIYSRSDVVDVMNSVHDLYENGWIYFCFNGEFLFYPFCDHRKINDLTNFMTEERRDSVHGYVLDLYGVGGPTQETLVMDRDFIDSKGYYGIPSWKDGETLERDFEIFGGLARRFEEHVPWDRRRINRSILYRARKGLRIDESFRFNDPEYNTIACPWHRNVTVALASYRVAKALKRNPGSANAIESFMWAGSERFNWTPEQLVKLGFIEEGQWF